MGGRRAYHFNEVFLDGVRIPATGVVGEVNAGWEVVHTTLANERAMIGGGGGGGGGASAPSLLALARELGRSGDPVLRQRIARVHILDQTLRCLGLRMRTALSTGGRPAPRPPS
jgi:alkylation response protein AidB-like acyl-CoA dehydrogenase